jgi:hypothetical protein
MEISSAQTANGVISDDAAALASQILGLKKAAGQRNTNGITAAGGKKGAKPKAQERSFDSQHQGNNEGQQNQMGTRSSSHGRLPTSQQPRQGSKQSKHRKSNQGTLTLNKKDENSPANQRARGYDHLNISSQGNHLNDSQGLHDGPNALLEYNLGLGAQDSKRNKARMQLQKFVEGPPGGKRSLSTQRPTVQ